MQKKSFFSELLQRDLEVRVTTKVIKEIDLRGGLDNYLLYTRPSRVASDWGDEVRQQLLEAYSIKHNKPFTDNFVALRYCLVNKVRAEK